MKTALVTGVGRRLGFAIAEKLLAEGWAVVGQYRSASPQTAELEAAGAELFQVDFDDAEATLAFAETLSQRESLDWVVHNASCFSPEPPGLAEKLAWSEACFNVHVRAPYVINEALHGTLKRGDDPNVVHITDIFAERPDPQYRAYTAAKAGLDNLALSYAKLWAPDIRVNRIQPGPILFLPEHSQAHKDKVLASTLLRREGGLTPLLDALWSLRDNAYMTGAVIKVDGGRFLAE